MWLLNEGKHTLRAILFGGHTRHNIVFIITCDRDEPVNFVYTRLLKKSELEIIALQNGCAVLGFGMLMMPSLDRLQSV